MPAPDIWDRAFVPPIIDIEASGFGRGSYPLEVGFAGVDGQSWCTLVRPQADWTHWDAQSQQLHGISRELISQRGRPVEEVARELNQRLRGQTLYSDAWGNDLSWLSLLFECAETSMMFRLEGLHCILVPEMLQLWDLTRARIGRRLNLQRHRASSDARMLQLTWLQLREQLLEQQQPRRLSYRRAD